MKQRRGFTIVEIMIVIVVIGILAAIVIISFGSWRTRTAQTEVKHELTTAVSAIRAYRTFNNVNPTALTDSAYKTNSNVTMSYILRGNGTYCLNAQSIAVSSVRWYVETINETPTTGTCS